VLTQAQQIIQLQQRYNEACEREKKSLEREREKKKGSRYHRQEQCG